MADYNVIQMKNKAGVALFPKTKINLVEGAEEFVNGLIANQIHMNVEVVESLPEAGVANKIYLVAKEGEEGNVHNEYLWINGKWELIGDTAVSLAGYATEDFVNTAISNKVTELNLGQYATTAFVNEQIEAVNKTITDLGVGAIEGRVDTLEGEMDAVEGRLDVVEPKVEQNSKDIAQNAADIKAINESAVMTSGITAELVGKITANETAIGNVYTKGEADAKFETIENVNAVKEDVAQNAADIETINESAVMTSGITSDKVTAYDAYVAVDRYSKTEADAMAEGKAEAAIEALDLANTYAPKSLEDNVIYFDVVETVTE